MLDLDRSVAELYLAYVAELGQAIEQVQPWWARLESIHDRSRLRLRWPAGVASHPRVLAIVRDYHRRVREAHRRVSEAQSISSGAPLHFDDDAAWGTDSEAAPQTLIPIAPERLLLERLQVEAPELYAKLIYLVMWPVGAAVQPQPSLRSLEVLEPDPRRAQAFHFEGRHGTARGLERLLGAAGDLRPEPLESVSLAEASEFHRLAHYAYLRDLERALVDAERWWSEELAAREVRGRTSAQAITDCYAAHPIGPASHPRVLGVIQAYWALCEEINAILRTSERRVAPEQLLLDWLRDGHRDSWVDALTAMPYWPIGLDQHGRWS
jgi:hypothetical protein